MDFAYMNGVASLTQYLYNSVLKRHGIPWRNWTGLTSLRQQTSCKRWAVLNSNARRIQFKEPTQKRNSLLLDGHLLVQYVEFRPQGCKLRFRRSYLRV